MHSDVQVLLVEDEAPKREHISQLLSELAPGVVVNTARSVTSALDILESGRIALLLLDMSLPTFDVGDRERGGRPQGFGGVEILRHMVMAEIECPTVVITGYEGFTRGGQMHVDLAQLRQELHDEFPTLIRAVLHYNSTYDDWKVVLAQTLSAVGLKRA